MAIAPTIPVSGIAGWRFLQATQGRQRELFNSSPDIERQLDNFKQKASQIGSLDELMSDRSTLRVVLGAYGLEEEIDKGAFVRRVLEDGASAPSAFAVRLNNANYLALAKAIPVVNGAVTFSSSQIAKIADKFALSAFESALGDVDNSMRLASYFEREITALAQSGVNEKTGWYKVMASVPLSTVIESAFNLPSAFTNLDLDKRADILSAKAKSEFGTSSVSAFADPQMVETAIRKFLLNQQIANGPNTGSAGMTALSILGGGISQNDYQLLLLSNAV